MSWRTATAFAPASVGNVAVGFDILGHSLPVLGDRVRAARCPTPGVRIAAVAGVIGEIPLDAAQNTAGRAVQSLMDARQPAFGVELAIEKGIPLGSGLGGSAASAVAAAVAANELLDLPLPRAALLAHAIEGEVVASGTRHADNVAASLLGGLVLTIDGDPPRCQQIPVPASIRCVVVHPHLFIATREARGILHDSLALSDHVRQSARLAGFLAGCYANDLGLIAASLADVLIEPQRAPLIPGLAEVQRAARAAHALGCSISGAGPSIFAWCEVQHAEAVQDAMRAAFAVRGVGTDAWIAAIAGDGATILERA